MFKSTALPWIPALAGRFLCLALIALTAVAHAREAGVREAIAAAILHEDSTEQREMVLSLKSRPSPEVAALLDDWRQGRIYLYQEPGGAVTPVTLDGEPDSTGTVPIRSFVGGNPLTGPEGAPIRINPRSVAFADTSSGLRRAMKEVSDLAALADPDPVRRVRAVQDSAIGHNQEKLPALLELRKSEEHPRVIQALEESIALIRTRSQDPAERLAAVKQLGERQSLRAQDVIRALLKEADDAGDRAMVAAATKAIGQIEGHISRINAVGTAFRGLSLGSVLLVVAIGLAITFGLMGIINMAHGEFIAIGAYTTYVVQHIFATGLNLSPFGISISIPGLALGESGASLYFALALPASFLVAAMVGILLERSVIQFLYKRPLESLLATWGISLVIQQLLKFIFGSNNVQVSSPPWLSGNWTVNDIVFGWNRVFVIGFAVLIIVITWLVLNRTSLGLMIRAVMQNRNMAACMGVRTERVNMMTFAFGCGLAGLAGAFLSQIGNVGPAMGQAYIVDSFMTVVVGGVGNILGTVISAIGIGMADQSLQQYLGNPVIGKILVLAGIILFLQWRPAGLFATRSRSLD
jgi:urea transport system permease protein